MFVNSKYCVDLWIRGKRKFGILSQSVPADPPRKLHWIRKKLFYSFGVYNDLPKKVYFICG